MGVVFSYGDIDSRRVKYDGVGDVAWRSIFSRSFAESSLNLTSYADVSIDSLRSGSGVGAGFGTFTDSPGSPRADELRVVAGLVKAAGFGAVNFSSLFAMSIQWH